MIINNRVNPRLIFSILTVFCLIIVSVSCNNNKQTKKKAERYIENYPRSEPDTAVYNKSLELITKLDTAFGSIDAREGITPDYYGGLYLNEQGRMVVQIIGDSLAGRQKIAEIVGSNDFEVDHIVNTYSYRELNAIMDKLNEAWDKADKTVMRNVQSAGVGIHHIFVDLIVNTEEKRKEFREKVMDSPAFIFTGPETPMPVSPEGRSDTCGVHLRAEYPVYHTSADTIKFILYNRSGRGIKFGQGYSIGFRNPNGQWEELPINSFVFDVEYGISHNAKWEFTAHLYPELHDNKPGNYRYFHNVKIGDDVRLVADFILTDNEEFARSVQKNPELPISSPDLQNREDVTVQQNDNDRFYAETMPQFPGGKNAMNVFIYNRTRSAAKIQRGQVLVQFMVEEDGTLSHVKIVRSEGDFLDNEARRIIGEMPKWQPAMNEGKPVRMKMTIGVDFYIPQDK